VRGCCLSGLTAQALLGDGAAYALRLGNRVSLSFYLVKSEGG
jgi:hypothetical protein